MPDAPEPASREGPPRAERRSAAHDYLIALRHDAFSDLEHGDRFTTLLFAFAGGTWAAQYVGLESAAALLQDFSWRSAGMLFSGLMLGVVLAWPVIALWRWIMRYLYHHIVANLVEHQLLLLAIEPDSHSILPLKPAATGMPDVADGSRSPSLFVDRIRLLALRYEKCCRAMRLEAYPRWAIITLWAVAFLALDLVLFIWLTLPDAGRPGIALLIVLAGVANLAFYGISATKKLAITDQFPDILLGEDDDEAEDEDEFEDPPDDNDSDDEDQR